MTYNTTTLLYNYLNYKDEFGSSIYADIEYASQKTDEQGNKVDTMCSRYVSGYLATLYLSDLASRQTKAGSAVSVAEGETNVSSAKLRGGLNAILKRMHDGETLDQVINSISPVVGGDKLYSSTQDFEEKFIKGEKASDGSFAGDAESLEFSVALLNCLHSSDSADGRTRTNGSILFDFDNTFKSPLNNAVEAESDFLKIIESNEYVPSTVPDSVALAGGGKSVSGTKTVQTEAAPADGGDAIASDASEGAVPEDPIAEGEAASESEASGEPVSLPAAAKAEAASRDSR